MRSEFILKPDLVRTSKTKVRVHFIEVTRVVSRLGRLFRPLFRVAGIELDIGCAQVKLACSLCLSFHAWRPLTA